MSKFSGPLVKSVYHRSASVSLLGLKIWNILPDSWKDSDNLYTFKKIVEKWKYENCPCRLCKIYIDKGKKKLGKKKKKNLAYSSSTFGITAVAYQYHFATSKYKLLFFYLFNRLFLAYWWIYWISSFLYLYRKQSINFLITISWLVSVWAAGVLIVWDSMSTLAIDGLVKFK